MEPEEIAVLRRQIEAEVRADRRVWAVEKGDVFLIAGATCIVGGSAWFHPALGVISIGLLLLGVAWRLSVR